MAFFHANLHYYLEFDAHNLMGQIYHKMKDYPRAEEQYLRAISIFTVLKPEGFLINIVLKNLGALKISQGDLNSAIGYIDQALAGLHP